MNSNFLFILLVLSIIIALLGTIALFSYLGISFKNNSVSVLKRAAVVTTNNTQDDTIIL